MPNPIAEGDGGFRGADTIGPGKGIYHFFRRLWFNLLVMFVGGKWSVIETFTKHRKLEVEDIPTEIRRQTVVITGGTRGIGAEVVKQCLQLDLNVIIGCRRPSAGETTVEAIRNQGIHAGSAEALPLDLNSLSSVRQFAETILNKNIPIHRLINNAGVMFAPFQLTTDGYECQFQTNYLSHFLLTTLLQPALNLGGKPSSPSRVINVSSVAQYGGHVDFDNIDMKKNYSPQLSYMCSKLMQVISTVDMNRKFLNEKQNIRVYSLHPGVVRTDLYENVWWVNFLGRLLNIMFLTPEQGADGVMYVTFSPMVQPDGGTFYANCSEEPVNPLALNRSIQDKLYEVSMELCRREAWPANGGGGDATTTVNNNLKTVHIK